MIEELAYLGGAIGFAVLPFIPARSRAAWSRWIFFALSFLFVMVAVVGLVLDSGFWNISKQAQWALWYSATCMRGLILGCVFVLLVSGELAGKKIVKDERIT